LERRLRDVDVHLLEQLVEVTKKNVSSSVRMWLPSTSGPKIRWKISIPPTPTAPSVSP
jgi:hypothetical protein